MVRQGVTPEPISKFTGPIVRWGEDQLEEVAREELRLSGLNTRFTNAALLKSFPSRTLEAIKKLYMLIIEEIQISAGKWRE